MMWHLLPGDLREEEAKGVIFAAAFMVTYDNVCRRWQTVSRATSGSTTTWATSRSVEGGGMGTLLMWSQMVVLCGRCAVVLVLMMLMVTMKML